MTKQANIGAFGAMLGRGLAAAGRGAASTVKAVPSVAASVAKPVVAGTVAAAKAVPPAAAAMGRALGTAGKATASASATYGRGMVGLGPTESAMSALQHPVRSAYRAATTPFFDPVLRPYAPRTADWLRRGQKAVVGISAAAGAAGAVGNTADQSADIAEAVARAGGRTAPEQIDSARTNAMWGTPAAAWKAYAPSWLGGDRSVVGNAARDAHLDHTARNFPFMLRRNMTDPERPWWRRVVAGARVMSPIGLATELTGRSMAAETDSNADDFAGLVTSRHDTLRNALSRASQNPAEALGSPLVSQYLRHAGIPWSPEYAKLAPSNMLPSGYAKDIASVAAGSPEYVTREALWDKYQIAGDAGTDPVAGNLWHKAYRAHAAAQDRYRRMQDPYGNLDWHAENLKQQLPKMRPPATR